MSSFKKLSYIKNSTLIGLSILSALSVRAEETSNVSTGIEKDVKPVEVHNKDKKDVPVSIQPTESQKQSYFETLGWMTIMQSGLKSLDLSGREIDFFIKGARLAAEGQESPHKLGDVMDGMQKFFRERSMEYEKKRQEKIKTLAATNRKAGEAFLKETIGKDKNIKKSASGLAYKIIEPGDSNKASEEDSVEIFYTGKLIDGKIFDQSKDKAVTFPLNGVVPGIKEGLQLIGTGGKIVLYIPDHLAYGEYDIPAIPAGSTLIFEINLVKIIKPVKKDIPNENK